MRAQSIANTHALTSNFEAQTYTKVTWRLIPCLFMCYVLAYLDRVNIGFAKLQMLSELKFNDTIYGLGAGIFFIGYFVFETPSNVILSKVGARAWIARIMVTWGIISACMMFVHSVKMFYVLRFLLGVAEAGFFPGIILYLTYWYPAPRRAQIVALFMSAVALAGVIGGPLSGGIMKFLDGQHGLSGWQWLFLIEGIPSVVAGIFIYHYLDDSIHEAQWLTPEEKLLLERNLLHEETIKEDIPLKILLTQRKIWVLSIVYFALTMGLYGVGFWLPQLIKNMGVHDILNVGLLTSIPYGTAAITMIMIARRSDKTGERRKPMAGVAIIGGIGLIVSALFSENVVVAMCALTCATACILSTFPLFWTLPTAYLRGMSAAVGIAMINSLGNLAGFVSPYMMGLIQEFTHSISAGIYMLAASLFMGAVIVFFCEI
ncbi:MAG: MFS transporter [Pseudomonadota bacterium]